MYCGLTLHVVRVQNQLRLYGMCYVAAVVMNNPARRLPVRTWTLLYTILDGESHPLWQPAGRRSTSVPCLSANSGHISPDSKTHGGRQVHMGDLFTWDHMCEFALLTFISAFGNILGREGTNKWNFLWETLYVVFTRSLSYMYVTVIG